MSISKLLSNIHDSTSYVRLIVIIVKCRGVRLRRMERIINPASWTNRSSHLKKQHRLCQKRSPTNKDRCSDRHEEQSQNSDRQWLSKLRPTVQEITKDNQTNMVRATLKKKEGKNVCYMVESARECWARQIMDFTGVQFEKEQCAQASKVWGLWLVSLFNKSVNDPLVFLPQ